MAPSTLMCAVVVFSGLVFIPKGYGGRCYKYACSNSTGYAPPCPVNTTECAGDNCTRTLLSYTSSQGITVFQDIRDCAVSYQCTPQMNNMFCNSARQGAANTSDFSCARQCCQGELCNSESFVPTMGPAHNGTQAPLQCYVCMTGPGSQGCDRPELKTCPSMYGMPVSCISVNATGPGPQGQNTTMTMRNCTMSSMCGQMCTMMGVPGCKESCCQDNGCNSEGLYITTTTPPPGGRTTVSAEGVKPATQILGIVFGLIWALLLGRE